MSNKAEVIISVRVTKEIADTLDTLKETLVNDPRFQYARLNRSLVARVALERGLELLRKESAKGRKRGGA